MAVVCCEVDSHTLTQMVWVVSAGLAWEREVAVSQIQKLQEADLQVGVYSVGAVNLQVGPALDLA